MVVIFSLEERIAQSGSLIPRSKKWSDLSCRNQQVDIFSQAAVLTGKIWLEGAITALALSSNENYLLAAYLNRTIKIFDIERQTLMGTILNAHDGIALWKTDATINHVFKIWFVPSLSAQTPSILSRVLRTTRFACLISSQGSSLVNLLEFMMVIFLFVLLEAYGQYSIVEIDDINSICLSKSGRFVISGSSDKSIKIHEIPTQAQICNFEYAHNRINTSPSVYFIQIIS